MASKAGEEGNYSEEDSLYDRRLVYDVIVYTLKKCGFPETRMPSTDCKEVVHNRANFVEIAGASVLRVSLIMRDKWKRMFISRRNSLGFRDEDVMCYLTQIALCCPLSRKSIIQSMVELLLALCNEIMLFFHHENMNIDLNLLLKSVSTYIAYFLSLNRDSSGTMEDLFGKFDNISEYTRWITDFIEDFAIPYGSRDDVSDSFFKYVKKQYKDELEKLKDNLGFLPHDLLVAITTEASVPVTEKLGWDSGPILSREREPPGPVGLPTSSGSGVLAERGDHPPRDSLSTNVSEETSQGGQSSSKMGLEDNLTQMSLGAEGAHLETPSTNVSKRVSQEGQSSSKLGLEDNPKKMSLGAEGAYLETPSTNVSKRVSQEGQSSSKLGLEDNPKKMSLGAEGAYLETPSTNVSKRVSQEGQSSPKLGLEDNPRKMSVGLKGTPLVNLGKIPKRKMPEKKNQGKRS